MCSTKNIQKASKKAFIAYKSCLSHLLVCSQHLQFVLYHLQIVLSHQSKKSCLCYREVILDVYSCCFL